MDAQASGASTAYANYVFGVYASTWGDSLSFTLAAADLYGQIFGNYKNTPRSQMDQTYTHIPATNVQNITAGYNAQQSGNLCVNHY